MIALARWLGALLGWIVGSVLRIRRAHVENAMRRAGVDAAGAMYASLGASAVEFLWVAARGERALSHVCIDERSREAWERARAQGRGVVIAASHTGNWDLAACAMARQGELLVVTKRLSVRWMDAFWQGTRARMGVKLCEARGAMACAREVLRRRGAVAMMIDQRPSSSRRAVVCDFLGARALVDRAPATLAASTKAPLVVAASCRGEDGRHRLHVLDVRVPPARPSRAWIDQATAEATRSLDAFVRAHPSQWLWLHRRWVTMLAAPCRTPTLSSSPAEVSNLASS